MTASPERWKALTLDVPSALADELIGQLWGLGSGATIESLAAGTSRVRFYLREGIVEAEAVAEARAIVERLGGDPHALEAHVELVEDGRWVERFQQSLTPFDLGAGYRVYPDGRGRRPIVLTPSRAFGTGEHPTTQLCVELLEQEVRPEARWLDVGAGTGILSLVVADRGGRAIGVEIDPDAAGVGREVLAANGVAARAELRTGSLETLGADERFDGAVANVHAPFFTEHGAALADRLKAGGRLVVSGFMGDQADGVARALARRGLELVGRREREPWAALLLGKR